MVDLNALNAILSTRNGVWASFMVLVLIAWRGWQHLPAIITAWAARRAAIQAAKDSDWRRLRDEIDKLWAECRSLRQAVQECEEREGGWMRRAIEAEAALMGRGKAEQEAAMIVAAERAEPEKATEAAKAADRLRKRRP